MQLKQQRLKMLYLTYLFIMEVIDKERICSECGQLTDAWINHLGLCRGCYLMTDESYSPKDYRYVYMDYFGFIEEDYIPCEISGQRAVDIHHIEARGMGGSKEKDVIDNLMALTRDLHERFGDIKELIEPLQIIHKHYMKTMRPYFNHIPSREEIQKVKNEI